MQGALVKLDLAEYFLAPGDSLTVQVIYEVTEPSINAANAGFRLESAPIGSAAGTLTTSLAAVTKSTMDPYIFNPNAGFFATGSGGIVATGGDNTDDGLEDLLVTGEYYLASITWTASADADGDFSLDFTSLGVITVLTDTNDNDFLSAYNGAVVHVPEPASLLWLAIGSALGLRRRG